VFLSAVVSSSGNSSRITSVSKNASLMRSQLATSAKTSTATTSATYWTARNALAR
jgi:hypothetical protein